MGEFYGRNIRKPELRVEEHPCYSIPRKVGKIFSEGNPIVMVGFPPVPPPPPSSPSPIENVRGAGVWNLESEAWKTDYCYSGLVIQVASRAIKYDSVHVTSKRNIRDWSSLSRWASASVVVNRVESTTIDVANGNIELTLESPSTFGGPIKKMIYQERSFILDDDEEAVWRRGESRGPSRISRQRCAPSIGIKVTER
ncbi:hypothetical protein HZH68_001612 [Vespula germanica]|uniref:Uncharacterized protein n=4 Tax=Vespula TaxID=7451 RepID=A0A834NWE7_VESGE|nr:hypothetical protein HZH66_001446 [Vespula vulgaris]KAF7418959.1 hypothetical protein HZH68_001612 [Vespula germanica]KAF7439420.1 hypothetical protein H0235_001811 [Vespula pensylvanica]